MTYAEALKLAKRGFAIRHPGMGPGWCYVWDKPGPDLWAVNPITGSWSKQFDEKDKSRTDWAKLRKDGGP